MQMRFKDGLQKALTFSYDDGNADDIRLAGIFTEHGMKATFNIDSAYIGDSDEIRAEPDGKLTWGEVKKYFYEAGHETAVHTLTHPWLASLSDSDALYEIVEDRRNIENRLGVVARGMAYPFGCFNDRIINVLKTAGIAYSRTVKATRSFGLPENPLMLDPTCHHNDAELMNLARDFAEKEPKWDLCSLFYVWGHSYEFARDNNWEIIENLCGYLAGRKDIWYATNIEIIDYIDAYKRLSVSYDKRVVYNPSAVAVWFSQNGIHCVNPGETVKL